jgi:hypothetical protein
MKKAFKVAGDPLGLRNLIGKKTASHSYPDLFFLDPPLKLG